MVYKFRVILDAEDIFRDIAILADDTLEDLHNAIFNSFGLTAWKWLHSILVMKHGTKKMKFHF
jgi:hypothetical protein